MQGSGKTEVAEAASKFDLPRVRMGDIVWEEVKSRELEINERNVGAIANEFRERDGDAAIAKRCVPLIEATGKGASAVVVDGIRGKAEVDEYRRVFKDWERRRAAWTPSLASRIKSRVERGVKAMRALY